MLLIIQSYPQQQQLTLLYSIVINIMEAHHQGGRYDRHREPKTQAPQNHSSQNHQDLEAR